MSTHSGTHVLSCNQLDQVHWDIKSDPFSLAVVAGNGCSGRSTLLKHLIRQGSHIGTWIVFPGSFDDFRDIRCTAFTYDEVSSFLDCVKEKIANRTECESIGIVMDDACTSEHKALKDVICSGRHSRIAILLSAIYPSALPRDICLNVTDILVTAGIGKSWLKRQLPEFEVSDNVVNSLIQKQKEHFNQPWTVYRLRK